MAKLWDKGHTLNALIERFTVGTDYLLDRRLIAADAVASIAHSQMLEKIGIISTEEADSLGAVLTQIAHKGSRGEFAVHLSDEDGHTAIENALVAELGEVGKKIHTGRSRNDQVIASTRLYIREGILAIRESIHACVDAMLNLADRERLTPMPGRTHLQPAMPSSVGLWAASYGELLLDDDHLLAASYQLVNRSPLGAAAGYGVPLPLDREMVADLLGFGTVQNNVIAVNNSRGKIEASLLESIEQIGITLGRFAQDLILFSMPEFGYFTLPAELCTGSSIMPQKQNPDGLELVRGKVATLSALATQVRNIVRALPSGYNRDIQDTKEPTIRGIDAILDMLAVVRISVEQLAVNTDVLGQSFGPDLMATDEVFVLVRDGMSFRDAYREVAGRLSAVSAEVDPVEVINRRTSTGTAGNLNLSFATGALEERQTRVRDESDRIARSIGNLVGAEIPLFSQVTPGDAT